MIQTHCNHCKQPLLITNLFCEDGCPCNSPKGVNFEPQPCEICKIEDCTRPGHRIPDLFGPEMLPCVVPPHGWACTRGYHVGGPCAAVPRLGEGAIRKSAKVKWVTAPGCRPETGVYGGLSFPCLRRHDHLHVVMFTPVVSPYRAESWGQSSAEALETEIRTKHPSVWSRTGDTIETVTLDEEITTYDRERNVCCHGHIRNGEFIGE